MYYNYKNEVSANDFPMETKREASHDKARKEFCQSLVPQTKVTYKINSKEITEIQLNLEAFSQKRDHFFNNASPQTAKKPLGKTSDLFEESFVIGEAHSHISPKQFLIANMEKMKANGYQVLFMEHLFYDTHQEDLDQFLKTGEMSNELMVQLKKMNDHGMGHFFGPHSSLTGDIWKKDNYIEVLQAARAAGIRIVGIDISSVYNSQKIGFDSEQLDDTRIGYMNYTAAHIMEREINALAADQKWCALMGNAHVNSFSNTPGIAELLHTRSVYIFDKPQWQEENQPHKGRVEFESEYIVSNGQQVFQGDVIFELDPKSGASLLPEHPSADPLAMTAIYKGKLANVQSAPVDFKQEKKLAIQYLAGLKITELAKMFGFKESKLKELEGSYHFVQELYPFHKNKALQENNTFSLIIESSYSGMESYQRYISKNQLLEFAAKQKEIDLSEDNQMTL